jgi:hypothetical protein
MKQYDRLERTKMAKSFTFHFWITALFLTELCNGLSLLEYQRKERLVVRELESSGLNIERESSFFFHPQEGILPCPGNSLPNQTVNPPFGVEVGAELLNKCARSINLEFGNLIEPQTWSIYDPVAILSSKQDAKIPPNFLKHLKKLRYLQIVDLDSDLFDDETLLGLKNAKFLWHLSLSGERFTDTGFSVLPKLPRLEVLYTNRTSITDKGIEFLRSHPSLRDICLDSSNVTDECLSIFETILNLERLSLYETKVTKNGEAITRLRNRMPQAEIFCEE